MKKTYISRIILVIAAVLVLGRTETAAQSAEYLGALELIQKGDFSGARTMLEKEIAANPGNDAAYYYLSTVTDYNRERMLVEECLKKALELSPDNFWYKYNLAVFYANTERPELTISLLEELISDYPKKNTLYFDLANLYVSQHEIDKALASIDKIEARRGKSEAVALTKLELMAKRPDADIDSAYAFLADYYSDCKTPRLACMLGDYYARAFKDSLALAYYEDATTLDDNYSPAYYGKAAIYQAHRQYDSFFENISRFFEDPGINPALKAEYMTGLTESPQFTRTFTPELDELVSVIRDTHPADSTTNLMASSYYYRTGRPYFSAEILKQTTELYPDSKTVELQYLIFLYYQKTWSALTEQATLALQRFNGDFDFLQLRAIAFSQTGNITAAIEDYQAILSQHPADSTVLVSTYSAIGDLYYQANDASKAFSYYEKAIKKGPNYLPALNNYAYYLSLRKKNLKKARAMSKKTIEAEPNNPTYLDTYAWILHLMGDDLEAKAIFKHSMLYGGKEDADILRHYSDVLEALGEKDLANIYRNQVKAMEKH